MRQVQLGNLRCALLVVGLLAATPIGALAQSNSNYLVPAPPPQARLPLHQQITVPAAAHSRRGGRASQVLPAMGTGEINASLIGPGPTRKPGALGAQMGNVSRTTVPDTAPTTATNLQDILPQPEPVAELPPIADPTATTSKLAPAGKSTKVKLPNPMRSAMNTGFVGTVGGTVEFLVPGQTDQTQVAKKTAPVL